MKYFKLLKKVIKYINDNYKPGETFFQKSIRKGLGYKTDNFSYLTKVSQCLKHLVTLNYLSREKKFGSWNYKMLYEIDLDLPQLKDESLANDNNQDFSIFDDFIESEKEKLKNKKEFDSFLGF